jgi:hypothetical protein
MPLIVKRNQNPLRDLFKNDDKVLSEASTDNQVINEENSSKILEDFEVKSIKITSDELKRSVNQSQIDEINRSIKELLVYQHENLLDTDEITEIKQSLQQCSVAIKNAEESTENGGSLGDAATTAGITAGTFTLEDMGSIGIEDPYTGILFVLLAAGGLLLTSVIAKRSPDEISQAYKNASENVANTIAIIGATLILLRKGDAARSFTQQIIIHLARILGTSVGGQPPDHQEDPEKTRKKWWKEILTFIGNIRKLGMSEKQIMRELMRKFSPQQIEEIKTALSEAAKLMNENPPGFPPVE